MKPLFSSLKESFSRRGKFARDVATIITGTFMSRVVALIALPILSRIFTPAEFGVLALFSMVVVIVACVANGRYDVAIVLPDDDRQAASLTVGAVLITTVVSLLSAVVLWFWGPELATLLGAEELNFWLTIAPLVIWILGVSNIFQFWVSRLKKFGYMSVSEVGGTTLNVSLQISLYLTFGLGAAALILGQISYLLTSLVIFVWATFRHVAPHTFSNLRWQDVGAMLRRYRRFPLYDSWATLLNTGSRDFPLLILGIFFTPAVVGLYSVAWRIMSMPVAIVSRNVMRVFLPEAKDGHAEGRLDDSLMKLFSQMLGFSMTPLLLGVIAAPELVRVILGENWVGAGIYIQWLSIFILLLFVEMPLMQTLTILEKVRTRLIYQIVLAGGRLGGLVAGGMLGDPVLAIALASSIGAVVVFIAIIVVLRYAGISASTTLGIFGTEVLRTLPYGAALLAAKLLTGNEWVVSAAFIVCGTVFFWLRLRGMLRSTA